MLDPLQRESVTDRDRSRFCIGGIVSKQRLMGVFGLTAAQANAFFAGEIMLRLGMQGSVRRVDGDELSFLRFHVRFLSD